MTMTAAANEMTVGTILASSWGYEQTNVNFYRVTKRTATMVTVVAVGKRRVESGDMTAKVVPTDEVKGRPMTRKIKWGAVKINDNERAYPWNGRPQGETNWG